MAVLFYLDKGMNTKELKNKVEVWKVLLVEREAIPKQQRAETTIQWCKDNSIPRSTYNWELAKPEIKKKITDIAVNNTKKHAPEILDNLGKRAKKNSRDTELYLRFILELQEKINLQVDSISDVIDSVTKETNSKQELENKPPVQDTEQETADSPVQP